jgi:hypothetical protein
VVNLVVNRGEVVVKAWLETMANQGHKNTPIFFIFFATLMQVGYS